MSPTPPTSANRRILLVDDNRAIHADFRKILSRPPEVLIQLKQAEATFFGSVPAVPPRPRRLRPGFRLPG